LIAVLYQGVCIVLVLVPESLHIHSIIFRALAVQHFHHVLFLELGRGEKIVKSSASMAQRCVNAPSWSSPASTNPRRTQK